MTDILVFSNFLFALLIIFYVCQSHSNQKNQDKIHNLFLNYKPEREIRNKEFIIDRFLTMVYPRLIPFNDDFVSKRCFKNLEFCVAEILVNILNAYDNYNYLKNDYMCLKMKTKFDKFLDYYAKCFDCDEDIYFRLLGQRVIRNMCRTELDMFNLYNFLGKILNKKKVSHLYFSIGVENFIDKNELLDIHHLDIRVNKVEIFNLYKYCFKNISE